MGAFEKTCWQKALAQILQAAGLVAALSPANAIDRGQDWDSSPEISKWYRELMQPDNPAISCCGVSDAYYADDFEVQGDQYIAIITDPREDAPLGRPHIPVGTRIAVPNHKLKWDAGNPTGHGVIFVNTAHTVYCYIVPAAI